MALFHNLEASTEVLAVLRPFFPGGWNAPTSELSSFEISDLANDAGIALSRIGELERARTAHELALSVELERRDWENVAVQLRNMSEVFLRQNHFALVERCLTFALELANLLSQPQSIFLSQLGLFDCLAVLGRTADAEQAWQALDPMGRNWHRGGYRPGDAEAARAQYAFERGTLTELDLTQAERLAIDARNRSTVRELLRLRGKWHLQWEEWADAVDDFADAVRMARESGIGDAESETLLALARLRLGRLPDPSHEAGRLAGLRDPAHLPLARLWHALGNTTEATQHALAAYRYAWADGEPFVHRYDLDRASELLVRLDVAIPTLPVYDRATPPQLAWQDDVGAAIDELRTRGFGAARGGDPALADDQ